MAQHDYDLENQTGFEFRADLNNALAAIATNNSGTTSPTPTYAHQWWFDTTNDLLKMRNELNNAWVTIAKKVGNNFFTYAASGTAASPGITFNGNPNTGLFSPATGVLGISSNGVERVRFLNDGKMGVNTQVPTETFEVDGNVKTSGNTNTGSLSVGGVSVIDSSRKLENVTGLKTVNGETLLGSGNIVTVTNLSEGTRTNSTVEVVSSSGSNAILSSATSSQAGVMSVSDKTKLDSLGSGSVDIGAIGTYAFLRSTTNREPGDVVAGSNLTYAGALNSISAVGGIILGDGDDPDYPQGINEFSFSSGSSTSPNGTWKCMGLINSSSSVSSNGGFTAWTNPPSASISSVTLWLRIS